MQKKPARKITNSKFNPLFRKILISLFFLFVILFSTFKISGDDDIFWHLETGRYIHETKSIPSSDIFGFATAGEEWIPLEWGWDLLSYWIYSFSGVTGISIFRTMVFLLIFYLFIRLIYKSGTNLPLSIFMFIVLLFGMIDRLIPKPQIMSYLFITLLLYLTISFQSFNRNKVKRLYVLPIIFIIWCNMHMGVIAGIALLAVFYLSELLCFFKPGLFGNKLLPVGKNDFIKLTVISIFCILVLFANPFGVKTYIYVYSHLNMKMLEDVFEWYSPFNKVFSGSIFQYVYFFFLFISALTIYTSFQRNNYFCASVGALFLVLSFFSTRYVVDFMLVTSLLASVALGYFTSSAKNKISMLATASFPSVTVSVILLILIAALPEDNLYGIIKYPRKSGFGIDSHDYPAKMFEFIKANDIQNAGSRPFNSFNIGGFFIFEFRDKKNFIDSRNLNDEIYYKYKKINNKLSGFEQLIEEFEFDYFVWFYPELVSNSIEINTSVLSYLINKNNDWKLIYWDDNSFLFVKNTEKFREVIDRFEYKYVNPLYYIYQREPLRKAISENMQDVIKEIQRKYKDEPEGNFINSMVKTFRVPVSK